MLDPIMDELSQLRLEKDRFFAADANSPLTEEQKQHFQGLAYFPANPALRLEVEIEEFDHKEAVPMPTSKGTEKTYTRYGRFRFVVEGQEVALTIYDTPFGFFLPFVDALAGIETYGGGRYLEPEPLEDGKFLVDFNQAYNPTCAYGDRGNCPIPPAENRLKVPIRAGEKIFSR